MSEVYIVLVKNKKNRNYYLKTKKTEIILFLLLHVLQILHNVCLRNFHCQEFPPRKINSYVP